MDLKTTTRQRRHAALFDELRRFLAPPSSGRPLLVASVGAGLAVRYVGRLSIADRLAGGLFRRIESGVRRLPMPDVCYESRETEELVAALDGMPFELTLVGTDPRVVRVVGSRLRGRRVDHVLVDLDEERSPRLAPYRGRFDLVRASAATARAKSPMHDNASANVRSLLRPGGILLGGRGAACDGLVPLAEGHALHRKPVAASRSTA